MLSQGYKTISALVVVWLMYRYSCSDWSVNFSMSSNNQPMKKMWIFLDGKVQWEWNVSLLTLYCCYTQHSSYITVIIINSILSVTRSGRHEVSSVKLINSHYLPTLLYGCEIWCIKQTESYKLNVIWNNIIEKYSARPLLYYCKSMSVSHIIDQRRILFWH